MRFLGRALFWLVVLALIVAGVGWFLAGREAGPLIAITSPQGFIGQSGALTLTVDTPATGGLEALVKGNSTEGPRLTRLDAVVEQNGQSMPVLSLDGVTPEELTSTGGHAEPHHHHASDRQEGAARAGQRPGEDHHYR